MKILIISHTYISPINRDKWKVLAKLYPDLHLAVVFPNRWPTCLFDHTIDESTLASENSINCTFYALPARGVGNEVRYTYNIKEFFTLLKQFQPDLIHIEQGASALSFTQAIIFSKILRLQTTFSFFTWINWIPKRRLSDYLFWLFIEKFNIYHAQGAITGNQEAKKILQTKKFHEKLIVLPQLGIDLNTFYPALNSSEMPKKLIGYIGRFVAEKGVFILLEAFTRINAGYPEWQIILVGKGPERNNIEIFIKKYHLENQVYIIDSLAHHEIAQFMRTLSVLVLPSYDTPEWKEQFGHVLIEAMASNIPILASNAGEIPHVIADAGLIFQQKNISDLESKLETLIKNSSLRLELAQAGYQRAKKLYTHEAIAHATYNFWSSLK